jgi:uncharacterized protein YjbI with pentapeptide repeats
MMKGDPLFLSGREHPQSRITNVSLECSELKGVNLRRSLFRNVCLTGACIKQACCRQLQLEDGVYDGMTIDGVLVTDLLDAYRAQQQERKEAGIA